MGDAGKNLNIRRVWVIQVSIDAKKHLESNRCMGELSRHTMDDVDKTFDMMWSG